MRCEHLVTILVPVTRTYWSVLGMLERATRQILEEYYIYGVHESNCSNSHLIQLLQHPLIQVLSELIWSMRQIHRLLYILLDY